MEFDKSHTGTDLKYSEIEKASFGADIGHYEIK